ncbi:hypothetical protein PRK78_005851 [Emydomyces testavorans]|uniref:Uncharacterized protein n=1 Tax=Emydomyces testavorans TaxID=2070801 RepID=A0AAF0DN00_9EURO|nr:hypothetical protein PRK78_005851 [Emydomyces testavorans]
MDNYEPQAQNMDPEIDLMILDYLAHMVIKQGQILSQDITLKLQILTFTNLFLRRYETSVYLPSRRTLQIQRTKNTERANLWLQQHGVLTYRGREPLHVPGDHLPVVRNYQSMLLHMGVPSDENVLDLESRVSLLDVLPEYMALCRIIPSAFRDRWMENAICFMLHSAIEQVFIYGRKDVDKLNEAFAWDWPYEDCQRKVPTAVAEKVAWMASRDAVRRSLLPPRRTIYGDKVRRLSFKFQLFEFEGCILELLRDLMNMLEIPILQQLESGTLCGLTSAEAEVLSSRINLHSSSRGV